MKIRLSVCPRVLLGITLSVFASAVAAENVLSNARLGLMDPDQVAFGKPASVSLILQNLPQDAMPALQPAGPFATHFLALNHPVTALAKYQTIVFAAAGRTVYSLDFSKPEVQTLASVQLDDTITTLAVAHDTLFAGTDAGQVLMYHIGADHRLQPQRTLAINAPVTALAVTAEKAYVLAGHRKLMIFSLPPADTTRRDQPQLDLPLSSRFNALSVRGTQVYLSGDEFGVQIVDVTDLAKPRIQHCRRRSGHPCRR